MRPALTFVLTVGLALTISLTAPVAAHADETPAPTPTTAPALTLLKAPGIKGKRRFGSKLTAKPGRWEPAAEQVRYQWLREGVAIAGADRRGHRIAPKDVGHELHLVVTVVAAGHVETSTVVRVGKVKHRVDLRRTLRYSVRARGSISRSDLASLRRGAQQTFDDPRGWRGKGMRFKRVRNGGAFTLWLATPGEVARFSSGCSALWSCRVGRHVIINVERWIHTTPAWRAAKGSVRGYRHMVVNHESGHFLGYGHAGCSRPGARAPVMMQQSKGLDGCRFNPWPTVGELRRR